MELGYKKPLFVLPFDHRASFAKKMFGFDIKKLTKQQTQQIADFKQIIYNGFKLTVDKKIAKESAAILVDEQFGDQILKDAGSQNYVVCLPVEKSGQKGFDFEYGVKFASHIKKYKPTIVKTLIRYNPEGDKNLNAKQIKKLKKLSKWCHKNNYKFMVEALVPPTEEQIRKLADSVNHYDIELRPGLMVQMVAELQKSGVEADIWKVEGLQKPTAYKALINQIRANGRDDVGTVVLGRGLDDKSVAKWLRVAGGIDGVIGFAVGRTIWWQSLEDYRDKKITKKQAAEQIAKKYYYFYQIFTGQK